MRGPFPYLKSLVACCILHNIPGSLAYSFSSWTGKFGVYSLFSLMSRLLKYMIEADLSNSAAMRMYRG